MPKLGFDMSSGKVVRWLKREGDVVTKGEPVLEIETDKATVEVQADSDGILGAILISEGDVPVGDPVGEIVGVGEKSGAAVSLSSTVRSPASEVSTQPKVMSKVASPNVRSEASAAERSANIVPGDNAHVEASPLAKRMALELGIDLARVKGSGPGGRITREDIDAFRATQPMPQKPAERVEPAGGVASAIQSAHDDKPLSRMRQAIARRMVESKGPIPQFHLTVDVDMAAAMTIVNQMLEAGKSEDLRPSPLSMVMKACGLMLRKYPNLNSSFGADKLLYHDFVNISVAVAVDGGLLTPVVTDCDRKSVAQIARDTRAAAARARAGKLSPSDLAPGTFSISNLGMFEIEHFIAIVNPPEAAILALGTAKEVPVVESGQIKSGLRMKMTLSADHRITDGAEAARFLQEMKSLLQTPMSLFL
jgi:pyruvate dehydrogenase E2 component (dihydrolipoamide acetyltransferase)